MINVAYHGGPREGTTGVARRSCPPCCISAKESNIKGHYEYQWKEVCGFHIYTWVDSKPKPKLRLIVGGKDLP